VCTPWKTHGAQQGAGEKGKKNGSVSQISQGREKKKRRTFRQRAHISLGVRAMTSPVPPPKQWGVLAAIEYDQPAPSAAVTAQHQAHDRQLEAFLIDARACDTPGERGEREAVLADIERHAQAWLALENKSMASAQLGRIYTFGSYALGVSGPAADVDTLLVGPSHVPRAAFFERFPAFLVTQAGAGVVTELTCRTSAYVPVISFFYRGVEIDLLYAQAACPGSVRDEAIFNIDTDAVLDGMDDKSILSINGVRATRRMLQLVPDHATFQQTLRFVKVRGNTQFRARKRSFRFPLSPRLRNDNVSAARAAWNPQDKSTMMPMATRLVLGVWGKIHNASELPS
jgi:hypothetical protein